MRRLYSSFADGLPGAALLMMRLVTGMALVAHAVTSFRSEQPLIESIVSVLAIGVAALLGAGLWTPVSGMLVTVVGLSSAIWYGGERSALILMAAMGAALALLGPGAWSVDAKLFGLKRIDIPDSKK